MLFPQNEPVEFHTGIITLHRILLYYYYILLYFYYISYISGISLPFNPVKSQGEPQSNVGSTLPRQAASVTTRTRLLGMAAWEVGIICSHQQLKNRESQLLGNVPLKRN